MNLIFRTHSLRRYCHSYTSTREKTKHSIKLVMPLEFGHHLLLLLLLLLLSLVLLSLDRFFLCCSFFLCCCCLRPPLMWLLLLLLPAQVSFVATAAAASASCVAGAAATSTSFVAAATAPASRRSPQCYRISPQLTTDAESATNGVSGYKLVEMSSTERVLSACQHCESSFCVIQGQTAAFVHLD